MNRRDHNWEAGFHHSGEDFALTLRKPGGHRITVPANKNFLDVHLGRSTATYVVSGVDTAGNASPPATFIFLPAGPEREIHASRSGWSMQLIFDHKELTQSLEIAAPLLDQSSDLIASLAIHHEEDPALLGIAQTMASIWRKQGATQDPAQFEATAKLLIMRIVFNLVLKLEGPSFAGGTSAPRIQTVLDYIEENLTSQLPLEELADVANLSVYHFARVFRTSMEQSPHQYIVERRLAFAKKLLNQTDIPIAQIAHDCGFSSQSHLTELFKKNFGVTPGASRKKFRQ